MNKKQLSQRPVYKFIKVKGSECEVPGSGKSRIFTHGVISQILNSRKLIGYKVTRLSKSKVGVRKITVTRVNQGQQNE
nr:hypothetical protein [Vibrio splendidus]MCC4882525.1 hypothetical protein [Vibrio splendidus]